MINTKDLIKIKEYDKYILFKHKDTGIRECILKIDLVPRKNEKQVCRNTWERRTMFDR